MIGFMQHHSVEGCNSMTVVHTGISVKGRKESMLWRWKFGVFVVAGKAKMRFHVLAALKPLPSTGITSITCRPSQPFTFA